MLVYKNKKPRFQQSAAPTVVVQNSTGGGKNTSKKRSGSCQNFLFSFNALIVFGIIGIGIYFHYAVYVHYDQVYTKKDLYTKSVLYTKDEVDALVASNTVLQHKQLAAPKVVRGPKGDPGPKGAKGERGLPGFGLHFEGTWDNFRSYQTSDYVVYEGVIYVAREPIQVSVVGHGSPDIDKRWVVLHAPPGPEGPVGSRGIKGDKGPRGYNGMKGDIGPSVFKGMYARDKLYNMGDIVYKDHQFMIAKTVEPSKDDWLPMRGDKGDTGLKGPRGYRGFPGEKGARGNTGLTGPTGKQGTQGVHGRSCFQGRFQDNKEYQDGDLVRNGTSYFILYEEHDQQHWLELPTKKNIQELEQKRLKQQLTMNTILKRYHSNKKMSMTLEETSARLQYLYKENQLLHKRLNKLEGLIK